MHNPSRSAPASGEESVYYHNDAFGSRILVRILAPWITGRVLEVGSGVGHVTSELSRHARTVVALEPSPTLHAELSSRVSGLDNVQTTQETLAEYIVTHMRQVPQTHATNFDTIVYINVLEHITDDTDELVRASQLLGPQGRVLIVVPAHQWLYSSVDRLSGHLRRYSKRTLRTTIENAGLSVVTMRSFESAGLIPYLVVYRLLRSTSTDGANATIYSRLILPLSYLLYRLSRGRLLGKNLISVAGIGFGK